MRERGIRLDVPRVQALLREGNERRDALRRPLVDAGIIQSRGPKKDPWRDSSVDQSVVQARLRAAGVTAKPKRRATDERPESGLLSAEGDVLRATKDPALVALAILPDHVRAATLGPAPRRAVGQDRFAAQAAGSGPEGDASWKFWPPALRNRSGRAIRAC